MAGVNGKTGGGGRLWAWLGGLLLVAAVAGGLALGLRKPRPVKVLLVTPPPGAAAGLSHYDARALGLLVQDVLEASPSVALTLASDPPDTDASLKAGEEWLRVDLEPTREGQRLGMRLSWRWSRGSRTSGRLDLPPGRPAEVLHQGLGKLPVALDGAAFATLVPNTDAGFWTLCEASSRRLQNRDLESAERAVRAWVKQEPRCASGWFLLGSLVYRSLLDQPAADRTTLLVEVDACFREGLGLLPQLPRGCFLLAQLRTNSGNHREALGTLLNGLAAHPRSPLLYTGVVYAARNAGLMELALQAADRRDRWAFTEHQPQAIDLLFLYLGDWPRFEHSLKEQPGHLRTTPQRFYRGFLSLVRGDRAAAIQAFEAAERVERGYPHYIQLARGYRLALQGRAEEACEVLRALESERVGLKVPDGEFSLRIAEGLALAGDTEGALDLCGRAFGQGAGCTLWYERSPLLGALRGTPRWTALIQHLRDRQALLAGRFPVSCLPPE